MMEFSMMCSVSSWSNRSQHYPADRMHQSSASRHSRSRMSGAVYASRWRPRSHRIQWMRTRTRPATSGARRDVGNILSRAGDESARSCETVARNDGFDRPRDLNGHPASLEVGAGRNADIETERSGKRPRDRVEFRVVGRQPHERRHTGRTPLRDQPNRTATAAGHDSRANHEIPRIRATLVRPRCPNRNRHVYPPVAHCCRAAKVELNAVDGRHGGRDDGQLDRTDVAGVRCPCPAASDHDSPDTRHDEESSPPNGKTNQVSSPTTAMRLDAATGGGQGMGLEDIGDYYPDSNNHGADCQLSD